MSSVPSVRELRRRWKPHKERLAELDTEHPTNIRFHRACSWLARTEKLDETDLDLCLILLWTAFNSLYGEWDGNAREPRRDWDSCLHFVKRIVDLDRDERIGGLLQDRRKLVLSILEDQYLSRYFWEEPSDNRARKSRKAMFEARTWFLYAKWSLILERVLERVYFLRCQIVHGAATCGSRLNRTALRRAVRFLKDLLPVFLEVWIEHGADEDWGQMCYPPLQ